MTSVLFARDNISTQWHSCYRHWTPTQSMYQLKSQICPGVRGGWMKRDGIMCIHQVNKKRKKKTNKLWCSTGQTSHTRSLLTWLWGRHDLSEWCGSFEPPRGETGSPVWAPLQPFPLRPVDLTSNAAGQGQRGQLAARRGPCSCCSRLSSSTTVTDWANWAHTYLRINRNRITGPGRGGGFFLNTAVNQINYDQNLMRNLVDLFHTR